MKEKYLIFDTSHNFCRTLKEAFAEQSLELLIAEKIEDARKMLKNSRPNGIIVNIEGQSENYVSFIQVLHTDFPGTTLIVTFNDLELIKNNTFTIDDLKNLGVSEVLVKPFHPNKILSLLSSKQGSAPVLQADFIKDSHGDSIELELGEKEFTKVEIENFLPEQAILFNVYVKSIEEGRFMRVLTAGASFKKSELESLSKEKAVKFLYFANKDRLKYVQLCQELANKILRSKTVAPETKVTFAKAMVEKYIESVFTEGLDQATVDSGKMICNHVYGMITSSPDLTQQLAALQAMEPTFFNHCFVCTFLVNVIAREFAWESTLTLETLGLASMLHDIGKIRLPKAMLSKRPFEMTKEELAEYNKHPLYGAEILTQQKIINPTVSKIVLQHHEAVNGSGFPYGISGESILIFSKILYFGDQLTHLMIEKRMGAPEAMKLLSSDPEMPHLFDQQVVANFLKVFKRTPQDMSA